MIVFFVLFVLLVLLVFGCAWFVCVDVVDFVWFGCCVRLRFCLFCLCCVLLIILCLLFGVFDLACGLFGLLFACFVG